MSTTGPVPGAKAGDGTGGENVVSGACWAKAGSAISRDSRAAAGQGWGARRRGDSTDMGSSGWEGRIAVSGFVFFVVVVLFVFGIPVPDFQFFVGKVGAVGHVPGHLLDDLETFHRFVLERADGLPVLLLGHSMGGLIVTAYMLEKPLKPDFLILSGPAIVPLLDPNDRTIDPTRLSKDPAVWQAYLEDPLILRERVDPELFVRLGEGLRLLPGRAAEISVPLLLMKC